MLSCLPANCVAPVLTTSRLSSHALSMPGMQPSKSTALQWRKLGCFSTRLKGQFTELLQMCSNSIRNYVAYRQPQGCSLRGTPTKHKKLCQQVEASIALQGAPGILIGVGALFAGVALAAFLLAAIPTLVVSTAPLSMELQLNCIPVCHRLPLICRAFNVLLGPWRQCCTQLNARSQKRQLP